MPPPGLLYLHRASRYAAHHPAMAVAAPSQGARIHTSRSSSVVRITGIALGWIGSTTAFGVVVKKP